MRRLTSRRKAWWKDGRKRPEHLFIPDTQVRPGVPIEHVRWAAEYALDRRPDVIVTGNDWFDYPSLSSWESEQADFRMRNVAGDSLAGLHAWELFVATLRRDRAYHPTIVYLEGNHEGRWQRAFANDQRLAIGMSRLSPYALVHKVCPEVIWVAEREIIEVDGVAYSHYFEQPLTGRPMGGTALHKLNKLKFSFTQGHVQIKDVAEQYLANKRVLRGLVAGAFYQHDEGYKGPQGNAHWRGVLYKHEVWRGNYDLMEVSMDFLRRRYGGERVRASDAWRLAEYVADLPKRAAA